MRLGARTLVAVLLALSPAVARCDEIAGRVATISDSRADWLQSQDDDSPLFFAAERPAPDITSPGPDMGDFPNSAATLPKGGIYIEQAPLTIRTRNQKNAAAVAWPFLLRFGLTDDVEFRLLGNGLASTFGTGGVSGFAPLALDLKVHLWDDRMVVLRPAASLEVILQTTWGTRAFSGGTQPSLNLNLDFPITEATNIEMTFGYSGVQDPFDVIVIQGRPVLRRENLNVNQFSYQYAIEHQVTERFQIFVHGFYNGSILLQSGPGIVVGAGYFYQLSQKWMLFNSFNAGLSSDAAPFSTQLGVAVAL